MKIGQQTRSEIRIWTGDQWVSVFAVRPGALGLAVAGTRVAVDDARGGITADDGYLELATAVFRMVPAAWRNRALSY